MRLLLLAPVVLAGCVTCGDGTEAKDGECVPVTGDSGDSGGGDSGAGDSGDSGDSGGGDSGGGDSGDSGDSGDTGPPGDRWTGAHDAEDAGVFLAGEQASDFAGTAVDGRYDLTGDGVPDVAIGASAATAGEVASGRVYIVAGPVTADVDLGDAAVDVRGDVRSQAFGSDLATLRDVNGDGAADLLVGAIQNERSVATPGEAWLYYGPLSGTLTASDADLHWTSDEYTSDGGRVVESAGDVDDDGCTDWMITDGSAEGDLGEVYLWYGCGGATSGGMSEADVVIEGGSAMYWIGLSVAGVGDVDGDGLDDILAGGVTREYQGEAFLFHGPVDGATSTDDADAQLRLGDGATATSLGRKAWSLAGGGDYDGDSLPDLILGGANDGSDSQGRVFVASGTASGVVDLNGAMAVITGETSTSFLGWYVTDAGDPDRDGTGDLWLGGQGAIANGYGSGTAFLFYGPVSGSHSAADADARFDGPAESSLGSVGPAADLTGDGFVDLLAGAATATGGARYSGGAWLFSGAPAE